MNDRYKLYANKVVEEHVCRISAFMATESYVSGQTLLEQYKTKIISWSILTKTISAKLAIAGSVDRMVKVELHNFYAENLGVICAIALQSGSWKAAERIQYKIEAFIRFVIENHQAEH
jgi:hypothetical protein